MPPPTSARLACASPKFVEEATANELDDWLEYFDPDVVILTERTPDVRAMTVLRQRIGPDTLLYHPGNNGPLTGPRSINGVQFIFAPTRNALKDVAKYEVEDLDSDIPIYLVSGLLELDVDTTTLSTTLVGRDEYRSALSPTGLDAEYVHISTRLPAEYRHEWENITVVGGGTDAGSADTPLVALDCRTDQRVLTRTVHRTQLGLRALDNVGNKRARRLRDAGFSRREHVADADATQLADIRGLGRSTVKRIKQSARAIDQGEIVRVSEDPLPSGDPVYIDIETDGLSPTITWLIGVLDGSADEGRYMAFLQTIPDDPGRAIEDFMTWFTANASSRPLVAYRGWKFDFSVIHDHIVEYCPQYEDNWTSTYRFDPYQWAVEDGNAIFPGRTNKLADVASALGYERSEAGLTGAAVARVYQQWMVDQSPEMEPDWERLKTYCEDDVRALAVVYEALEESGRIVSTSEPSCDVSETTTQGNLSDW